MDMGGVDILLVVPPGVPAVDLILDRLRRSWPNALFVDAQKRDAHPISDPGFRLNAVNSREFLIYQSPSALNSWQEHGACLQNTNSMLHFVLDDSPGATFELQELTLVCDERTEAIDRLARDLELTFLYNSRMNEPPEPRVAA